MTEGGGTSFSGRTNSVKRSPKNSPTIPADVIRRMESRKGSTIAIAPIRSNPVAIEPIRLNDSAQHALTAMTQSEIKQPVTPFAIPGKQSRQSSMTETRPQGNGDPSKNAVNDDNGHHTSAADDYIADDSTANKAKTGKELKKEEEQRNEVMHIEMIKHFKLRSLSVANVYGENTNVEKEMIILQDQVRKAHLSMQDSTFALGWSVLTMFLVLWQSIYIPFMISFNPKLSEGWKRFEICSDIFFIADVLYQFNVAVIGSNGELLVRRRDVALNYLRCWFWIDFVAALPLDKILDGSGASDGSSTSHLAQVNMIKVLRLPRLFRIFKVIRVVKTLKIDIEVQRYFLFSRHAHVIRLFVLVVVLIYVSHCFACAWFVLATSGDKDNWFTSEIKTELSSRGYGDVLCCADEGTILGSYSEAWEYERGGEGASGEKVVGQCLDPKNIGHFSSSGICQKQPIESIYMTCVYSVIEMMIGQEHIQPISQLEKTISSLMTLFGALVTAVLFGQVAVHISNYYANSSNYQKKMEFLFESMHTMDLPRDIQRRVYNYYEYIYSSYGSLDGNIGSFLPELSEKLRAEILLYLRIEMIASVPFFAACSPDVVYGLVMDLRLQVYLPKDYVVVRGEFGNQMFFIQEGECEVTIAQATLPSAVPAQVKQAHRRHREEEHRKSVGVQQLNQNHNNLGAKVRRGSFQVKKVHLTKEDLGERSEQNDSRNPLSLMSLRRRSSARAIISNEGDEGATKTGRRRISMEQMKMADEDVADEYKTTTEKVLKSLPKGSYFGEVALLLSVKRTANVRSCGFSELCILDRDVYAKVIGMYAEDELLMEEMILSKYDNAENVAMEVNKNQEQESDDENIDRDESVDEKAATGDMNETKIELNRRMDTFEAKMEKMIGQVGYLAEVISKEFRPNNNGRVSKGENEVPPEDSKERLRYDNDNDNTTITGNNDSDAKEDERYRRLSLRMSQEVSQQIKQGFNHGILEMQQKIIQESLARKKLEEEKEAGRKESELLPGQIA